MKALLIAALLLVSAGPFTQQQPADIPASAPCKACSCDGTIVLDRAARSKEEAERLIVQLRNKFCSEMKANP